MHYPRKFSQPECETKMELGDGEVIKQAKIKKPCSKDNDTKVIKEKYCEKKPPKKICKLKKKRSYVNELTSEDYPCPPRKNE